MKIYCSGIGGIGLSAYASLQCAAGHDVSGSDRAQSALTLQLGEQGISVYTEQDGSHVPSDADVFVYSEAIPIWATERVRATEFGIPQWSYFKALGELSRNFHVIAVCGTHGKSSTTSMAAKVLVDAGVDPTVVVGTKVPDLENRNWRRGKSDMFLLEACEYRRSFHHLSPDIVLMTNVDGDHFDAYGSLEEYQQAFRVFLELLPPEGVIITHVSTDRDCAALATGSKRTVIDADTLPMAELQVPGAHMQQNAQLVLALAKYLGFPQEETQHALRTYAGCWRRTEVKGTFREDITVIDDYGHHPREIEATLRALRGHFGDRRIVCVFQPHTHDRTLKLYDAFTKAFTAADLVVIPDVYEARKDIETTRVDVPRFVQDISLKSSVQAFNGFSLGETEKLLREQILLPGDVLVCMGAGPITQLASSMVA